MSRRLLSTISHWRQLPIKNQKTVNLLSRFLSNGSAFESNVSNATPVTFRDGFFRFKIDNQNFVVSFWTPVNQVADVIKPKEATQIPIAPGQELDTSTLAAASPIVKVLDMNQEEIIPEAEPMALGTVLSDSGTIVVEDVKAGLPVQLKLDGIVDDLKKWMLANAPPKPFDLQVLEKERESVVQTYNPMEEQFMNMLVESESQAQKRFKWGGLFFLSAQLGFVARLTWFEYSWDIMEPITWCLTYTMMLGTFSYYIFTTQEFMLPLVEKRAIQERFWKNVKKSQFDVNQFKQLRTQLISIERRAKKARSTPFTSSIPLG